MLVPYLSGYDTAEASLERAYPVEYRNASSSAGGRPNDGREAGTGGLDTLVHYLNRPGYPKFTVVVCDRASKAVIASTSFTDVMGEIKSSFGRTMSSLPAIFGVSRQSLYNWIKGEVPKENHHAKIFELAEAGQVFTREGVKLTSAMLDRKLAEGKSFLQLMASGAAGEPTAKKLVYLVQRGQRSKTALKEILGDRKTPRPEISDMGAPSFSDDA